MLRLFFSIFGQQHWTTKTFNSLQLGNLCLSVLLHGTIALKKTSNIHNRTTSLLVKTKQHRLSFVADSSLFTNRNLSIHLCPFPILRSPNPRTLCHRWRCLRRTQALSWTNRNTFGIVGEKGLKIDIWLENSLHVKVVFFLLCYFGCCKKFEDSHYSKHISISAHSICSLYRGNNSTSHGTATAILCFYMRLFVEKTMAPNKKNLAKDDSPQAVYRSLLCFQQVTSATSSWFMVLRMVASLGWYGIT